MGGKGKGKGGGPPPPPSSRPKEKAKIQDGRRAKNQDSEKDVQRLAENMKLIDEKFSQEAEANEVELAPKWALRNIERI
jgi:hypothetical protein